MIPMCIRMLGNRRSDVTFRLHRDPRQHKQKTSKIQRALYERSLVTIDESSTNEGCFRTCQNSPISSSSSTGACSLGGNAGSRSVNPITGISPAPRPSLGHMEVEILEASPAAERRSVLLSVASSMLLEVLSGCRCSCCRRRFSRMNLSRIARRAASASHSPVMSLHFRNAHPIFAQRGVFR